MINDVATTAPAELLRRLAGKSAVFVVGTGVTIASCVDPEYASWPGLLRGGVAFLKNNQLGSTESILSSISNDVEIGIKDDGNYLISAGQKLIAELNKAGHVFAPQFWETTIGSIHADPAQADLINVIAEFDIPILTTNYDTILEQTLERTAITWRDTKKMRDVLRRDANEIVHLHGLWNEAESIILTISDYEKIINDTSVQALRQALGALQTIVFVGYGNGLTDPHFSDLWLYLNKVQSFEITHYTLCRQSDLETVKSAIGTAPIYPVVYGSEHEDLKPFLRELHAQTSKLSGPLGSAEVQTQLLSTCRQRILDEVTDTAVMPSAGDHRADDPTLDDLVMPPILLPVPPEQYARERANRNDVLQPIDPVKLLQTERVVTLTGDEQSGLTTALSWLLLKKSAADDTIPMIVDFKRMNRGPRALQHYLRKQLRSAGASINNKDLLPKNLAIAVDNVTSSDMVDLRRLVTEIVTLDLDLVVLGCRPGTEIRIQSAYSEKYTDSVPLAYLGRLGLVHATEIARRIDPYQANSIAERVLKIATKEGLTRNPLSVTLLIVGVSNDEGWINAVSNTSFVDAFVDSLLGRGTANDDMRLQIDAAGYSQVLQLLAKRLVSDDAASISRLDLISFFSQVVADLDWSDRPEDIIRSLVTKGLLLDREGSVRFRQSAYLHIFVARAALGDTTLLETLKSRPLYYSAGLRNYAALKRTDESLLRWAGSIFEPGTKINTDAGIFSKIDDLERQEEIERLNQDGELADDGPEPKSASPSNDDPQSTDGPESGEPNVDGSTEASVSGDADPYESHIDIDRDPFPSTDLESADSDLRINAQLTLVSNILRDSELVVNPSLKQEVLEKSLIAWARSMEIMHDSQPLRDTVAGIVEVIRGRIEITDEFADDLKLRLAESWAVYTTFDLMREELATLKLQKALTRTVDSDAILENPGLAICAMLLQIVLLTDDWSGRLREVLLPLHQVRAARIFVHVYLSSLYDRADPGSARSRQLETLIMDFRLAPLGDIEPQRRNRIRQRFEKRLRLSREMNRSGIANSKEITVQLGN